MSNYKQQQPDHVQQTQKYVPGLLQAHSISAVPVEKKSSKPIAIAPAVNKTGTDGALAGRYKQQAYFCGICCKKFAYAKKYKAHCNSCKEHIACEYCNKRFNSIAVLERHKRSTHLCSLCDVISYTALAQKQHRFSHLEKKYICDICGLGFKTANILRIHVNTHIGIKRYECEVCMRRFQRRSALAEHMLIHSKDQNYVCEHCGRCFARARYLKIHTRRHTGEKPYKCQVSGCSYECYSSSRYYRHKKSHDPDPELLCEICGMNFKLKFELRKHMKTKHDVDLYVCKQCGETFAYKNDLIAHEYQHGLHQCKVCEFTFTDIDSFKEHSKAHLEKDTVVCNANRTLLKTTLSVHEVQQIDVSTAKECHTIETQSDGNAENEEYVDASTEHIGISTVGGASIDADVDSAQNNENDDDDNTAEEQNTTAARDELLTVLDLPILRCDPTSGTQTLHSAWLGKKLDGLVKFTCNTCGRAFNDSHTFVNHRNTHAAQPFNTEPVRVEARLNVNSKRKILQSVMGYKTAADKGADKYYCKICGAQFRFSVPLRNHVHVHFELDPLQCDYCDKTFQSYPILHAHHKKHLRGSLHRCTMCPVKFSSSYLLAQHKKVHKKQQFYYCSVCGRQFASKSALKVHMHRHTGHKPHVCEICNKSFLHKGHLNEHKQMHSSQATYKCNICGKHLRSRKGYATHCMLHTHHKQLVCEMCGAMYHLQHQLMQHIKEKHAGVTNTNTNKPFHNSLVNINVTST